MLFALLAALAQPAHAGAMEFTAHAPVLFSLNGVQQPYGADGATALAQGLAGRQLVTVSGLNGSPLWSGPVDIPGDMWVRCRWMNQAFQCYESTPMSAHVGVSAGGAGASMVMGPNGMQVQAGDGYESVTMTVGVMPGVMPGMNVAVNPGMAPQPQVVYSQAPPPPHAPPAAPPPPLPDRVQLVIRSTDGEWADVVVDGKVVLELRNEDEGMAWVSPGVHTVEIREFMEDEPYARGRLDTGYAPQITLGITEGAPVQCYNHDGWSSR
ncbi:MAG: hypothetical protein JXX28_03455 [Deltaproteobacteria bacterium]|nr:hypothetical protein [Deltaproteobacteria bacterium]